MKKMEKTVKVKNGDETKEVTIEVRQPNNNVIKAAERYKSKVWNESIQDGVLTKKELAVIMKKRKIWDEAKDEEESKITAEIVALEKELYRGKDGKVPKVSEGRDIAIQIRKKRLELRDLIAERIGLEDNTADSLADNARFDYLVATCTYYSDGNRVYKDFDEYNNKSADEIAFAAAELLGQMMYNLDSSFEKNLPENKFLSKFQLINDDLSLIDPNNPEHLIDIKGRRIDNDGYLLDENGNRVDQEGNAVTADGDYEMVEYENDLVVSASKPRAKPKTRKKKVPAIPAESKTEATES